MFFLEGADAGRRRCQRGGKARAFLVAESQHVDGERQAASCSGPDDRPPEFRTPPRADRHSARHRSRCRYANRSAACACWPSPRRPRTVPSASSLTFMPASRIHCATRSAARRCSGVRNSRTSRSDSDEIVAEFGNHRLGARTERGDILLRDRNSISFRDRSNSRRARPGAGHGNARPRQCQNAQVRRRERPGRPAQRRGRENSRRHGRGSRSGRA